MHRLNDALIIGSGVVAQAASANIIDIGSAVSSLGPTALLGIGIVWAIRRGDKLVDELHEVRSKHDAAMERMAAAMAENTEVIRQQNHLAQWCKDSIKQRGVVPV